jgi:hypothetical protein
MAHTARFLKNALQGTALLLCVIVVAEELGFPLDDNSLEDDIASGSLCCDAEPRFLDSVLLSLLPTPLTKQTPILTYVFYVGVHPSSSPNISILAPVKSCMPVSSSNCFQ